MCVKTALYCVKRVPTVSKQWQTGRKWAQYATVTQKSPMLRQKSLIRLKNSPILRQKSPIPCQNSPMLRQKSPICVKAMADGTEMSKMRDGNSKEPCIASWEYHVCQKRPTLRQKSPFCVKTALYCVKRVSIVSKRALCCVMRVPFVSKETHLSPFCVTRNEPDSRGLTKRSAHCLRKQAYFLSKEPYITSKESHLCPKKWARLTRVG